MRIHAISVVHMESEIVASSLTRFNKTAGVKPDTFTLVSHHWPLEGSAHDQEVRRLSRLVDGWVVRPEKNLGGHGGFNYALRSLTLKEGDLVLAYDPDSWPAQALWLKAMRDVMAADPKLAYVSLLPYEPPKWTWSGISSLNGHRVGFLNYVEMWNVTLFRGTFLREGMLAKTDFYGHVEVVMRKKAQDEGLRHGYLVDFKEAKHPIEHPEIYRTWKRAHADGRFAGNFDEYVAKKMAGLIV